MIASTKNKHVALVTFIGIACFLAHARAEQEGVEVENDQEDEAEEEEERKKIIHGSLELAAWAFVLPLGIVLARGLRHRPNTWWFKAHFALQPIGLIFAIAGWIVALKSFPVFEEREHSEYVHAVLGTTAVSIGIFQAINASLRPHAPEDNKEKSTLRTVWEVVHKGLGCIGVILGIVAMALGIKLMDEHQNQLWAAYIAGLVVVALVAFLLIFDKALYKRKEETEAQKEVNSNGGEQVA
jgi:protein-S-isoprenylcysteine O-methyltransferase Ste14